MNKSLTNKVVYGWYHNGEVFYIGIGSIARSTSKCGRNSHCSRKRAKAERENCFEVRILEFDLTFEEACEIECQLIRKYGRLDNGTGILTNMTDGGEGISNFSHSQETKDKIRSTHLKREMTAEHKENISNACYGRRPWNKGLKGAKSHSSKEIVTPFGIFVSLKEASEKIPMSTMVLGKKARDPNNSEYFYS